MVMIDLANLHRVSLSDDLGRCFGARRGLHGFGVGKSWVMSDDDGLGDGFLRSLACRETDMVGVYLQRRVRLGLSFTSSP
jgi:hypothetical protein